MILVHVFLSLLQRYHYFLSHHSKFLFSILSLGKSYPPAPLKSDCLLCEASLQLALSNTHLSLAVECLLSIWEALDLIPSTEKK